MSDYAKDVCLHRLFEAQVERTPDAVAVTFENKQLTYRELNRRANQLAHYLKKLGVGPEVLVGICVERSPEMIIGILGVLKAGGAYVPLDPAYPKERLAFILEDSQASILLTQQRLAGSLAERSARVICLDADWDDIVRESDKDTSRGLLPGNLAYVLYTSGSTGKPKGVAIEHKSAAAFLSWAHIVFTPQQLAGVLASTSICFDLSVFELFAPLTSGGKVIVAEDVLALPKLRTPSEVTLVNTVPSALAELLRVNGIPPSVRTINLAGEPLSAKLVQQIYEATSAENVYDLYGPSEATTYSTWAIRTPEGPQTIGKPISNTQIYILDDHLNPVPLGVAGELHIGGAGLARGYWNQPELTAEKFIPDPFGDQPGARLYKTGDVARYLPDGNIEFLGRIDHQVKIRGFRIELGEIESVLCQHPAVQQAVVLAREDIPREKQLVAYLVPKESTPTTNDLRSFLQQKLPDYMVPSFFVFLDALPLTPNGKIDRKALPAPDQTRPDLAAPFVAPRTPVEEVLEDIWAEVLGLTQIGIHDNFLELGGHSLRATQIASRVRDAFQVELPLPCLFATPTIAGLAKIIEGSNARVQNLSFPPIQPIPRSDDLPLSFSQERAWFIQQLDPANLAYNFQATLRFTGSLDVAALEQSLNEMVRRHEVFRTTFPAAQGRPIQVIHPFQPAHLPVVDLQALCESERESEAQRWIHEELRKPFDLTQLPMIRWILLRLSEQETILLHVEHHLVHDGWSFTVFLREVLELYKAFSAGKLSPLPELPIQFADFAHCQRQWLQGEVAELQLAYWKQKLAGNLPVLALPTDRPRPAVQSFRGAAPRVEIPLPLRESLRALSRREGVTLFMTMLSAFLTLLHRYTGQYDICVGSGIANRRWRETEGLIGMLLNNVVLRADLSGNPRFRELLRRVRDVTLAASAHQDLPFDQVVQALEPERDLSRNPLFQAMFSFHDSPMPDLVLPGLSVDLVEALSNGSAKFDLNVIVIPRAEQHAARSATADGDGITLIWEYNTDLFDAATITRMIGHYQTLLESIVADPEQRLSELPLLTELDRRQTLIEWNDTKKDYPRDNCIHELFEAQAKRTPDAVATVFQDKHLTYGELNRRANQLAHYLNKLGVGPEVLVGICMERSLEMIVGLLGVLKAGGAYVPLDPSYPDDRLDFMLKDTQAPVLLTQRRLTETLPKGGVKLLCLDTDGNDIARESEENLNRGMPAENLAYVIYTSGSTGKPKGVGIPHRGVVRLLFGIDYVHLDAEQTFLQLAPISFDASTFEIWGALLHGSRCVLFPGTIPHPGDLGDLLRKQKINTLWLTASLFNAVINEFPEALSDVRQLLIGGEALSVPHVQRALSRLPNTTIINGYGPTESTTFSCCYPIPPQPDRFDRCIPIGRPIGNTRDYILDEYLNPVPIGIPGEIYIGGEGLARGYLNRPELTAEKFIPNPFSDEPGSRLYKTGDLARYRPDGNIEFLGRIDHQVKIRGFRIELAEIETVLSQQPVVREAVVIAREDVPGDRRLVAYITLKQKPAPMIGELRRFLQAKLPDYMVPSAFVLLEALPLAPNGKVDRKALPVPDLSRPELDDTFSAPRTPIEEIVAGIWAEVLKLDQVGIHDNFFDLGGHSLLATQVISRLRVTLQMELPLRFLFEDPTVAGLTDRIEETRRQEQGLQSRPIQSVSRAKVLPLSFSQQRLWFLDQYEPESSVYNIPSAVRLTGALKVSALEQSLQEMVNRHEALRTTFSMVEGQAVQVIAPSLKLALPVVDLSETPEAEREQEARRLVREEARRPFDLSRGPLVRATVIRLGEDDHVLVLTMHHIVSDGWSMGVLYRELSVLYQAFSNSQPSPLPDLPIQYGDYAVWQREWLMGEELERQISYWKKQLEGVSPLQLPTDRPRPPVQTHRGAWQSLILPKELTEQLKSLSRKEGVTLYMTLLAAFQSLLNRYTGQTDIVVGTPIAGRTRLEVEKLIGFFVNTLVLRADCSNDPTFRELLDRVKQKAVDAYAHQEVPFEKLVEELQPERNIGGSPLFQVTFQLQNTPRSSIDLPGLTLSPVEAASGTAKFDLSLSMREEPDGLKATLEYNTDLFDDATITRMLGHLQVLLEGIAADPDQRISEVLLLTEAEKHQLLVEWNDTETDYPKDKCIHQLFETQVEKTPDAIALVFEDQQLTYRDLNNRANQLAHYLQKQGVGPEVLVGICVERSLEMIVGLLGILKSGGAYVPLDPAYPQERLAFMLEDTQAKVLLTQKRLTGGLTEDSNSKIENCDPRMSSLAAQAKVICLDGDWDEVSKERQDNPRGNAAADSLAYVIYTSGSTGKPKGVAVEHRQLINYLVSIIERLDLTTQRSFATVSTLAADLSNTVIFSSLCSGAALHVMSRDRIADADAMADYFSRHAIDCLKIVPSHLAALQSVPRPERVLPRQLLILGGEASDIEWVKRLATLAPGCRIVNHYGPTETTVGVMTYAVNIDSLPNGLPQLPLGRPIANTQIYILDQNFTPVPIGVAGELYVGGLGLARGYLNRPELTAEKFIHNPFSAEPGTRLYKTGDRARYLADGNIEFLGRIDNQIKLRGYRIEPGEIEAALKQHAEVREAVVLDRSGTDGGKQLAAYLVVTPDRAPTVVGKPRHRLPNGTAVVQLNKNETDYIYREIFERQAYLRHGITIKDGDCIFDVGANIGLFTVFANQIAKSPRTYSFEPNPAVYEILKANAKLYGTEVRFFNCGLSDKAKSTTFTFFPGFSLLSGFYADAQAEKQVVKTFMINQQKAGVSDMTELVAQADAILEERFTPQSFNAELRTVSSVIEQDNIECIDLLKINVEKSELDVLLGIDERDWQKIQQIVLEVDVQENLPTITSLLERHGYEYVVEQDQLLAGTSLCYVYAIRPSEERRLIREQPTGTHVRALPVGDRPLISAGEMRDFLATKLPEYMIPSSLVFLDALPLTFNGKVDRQGLLASGQDHANLQEKFEAPRTPVEELLTQIWSDVLKLDKIGIHDNFFELGGHSLLATQIVSRVRSGLSVELPLRDIFEAPTVYALAQRVQDHREKRNITQGATIARVARELYRVQQTK